MNQEDYCSYELAKKLKACGFDEPCDSITFSSRFPKPEWYNPKAEKDGK